MSKGEKEDAEVPFPCADIIPQGIAGITSCLHSQKSHRMPNGLGSVFTHLFCEGIKKGLGALRLTG